MSPTSRRIARQYFLQDCRTACLWVAGFGLVFAYDFAVNGYVSQMIRAVFTMAVR